MINWLKNKKEQKNAATRQKSDQETKQLNRTRSGKGEKQDRKEAPVCARLTREIVVFPSNFQHQGARERQEDAFAVSNLEDREQVEKNGVFAVVADGMGGLSVGQKASHGAVSAFIKEYAREEPGISIQEKLLLSLQVANATVFDLALKDGEVIEMGTTLVAAAIHADQLYWVSAGDSRIYLCRDGQLLQLNKDHIYANQLKEEVKNKRITRDEAENHPERGYLTSYLGLAEIPEIEQCAQPLTLKPNDAVMICSDGLYNALSLQEMADIIQEGSLLTAELLVGEALSKKIKHQDNITVVILSCQATEAVKTVG